MQHDLLKRTQNVIGTTVQNKKFRNDELYRPAGHELQVSGKTHLVPIDAKLEWPGDLALETVERRARPASAWAG
jgi:hypothetical protein